MEEADSAEEEEEIDEEEGAGAREGEVASIVRGEGVEVVVSGPSDSIAAARAPLSIALSNCVLATKELIEMVSKLLFQVLASPWDNGSTTWCIIRQIKQHPL